jgi:hypothetical protein
MRPVRTDGGCPPYRLDAEIGLKRFLSNPDARAVLLRNSVAPPDSADVRPVDDATTCAALDAGLARALADFPLMYDPAKDYLSYFAAGDAYFARIISRPPQELGIDLTPPPGSGIDGYVFLSTGSVVVFGPDRRFVEAFAY